MKLAFIAAFLVSFYTKNTFASISSKIFTPLRRYALARIPERATKLLFSVNDSKFSDNSDPNNDFMVKIFYYVEDIHPNCPSQSGN